MKIMLGITLLWVAGILGSSLGHSAGREGAFLDCRSVYGDPVRVELRKSFVGPYFTAWIERDSTRTRIGNVRSAHVGPYLRYYSGNLGRDFRLDVEMDVAEGVGCPARLEYQHEVLDMICKNCPL